MPPSGILTRVFNYGESSQAATSTQFKATSNLLDQFVTVGNNGAIWINRSGKIGFIDENNLQNRTNANFDARITIGTPQCAFSPTEVTIQSNGSLIVGDASVNNSGTLNIEQNTTLDIQQNGTLRIENNSQLIVGNGGQLIINAGANINLVG